MLTEAGIHPALAFLNARTSHRFTGIYRLDPPVLRNVRLYDRENPELEIGADAAMRETYCSIVGETCAPFATADPRLDERLAEHPAREATLAYCGVPLRDERGNALGTLCHFDVVPRPVDPEAPAVLEAAAPLLLHALREEGAFPSAP